MNKSEQSEMETAKTKISQLAPKGHVKVFPETAGSCLFLFCYAVEPQIARDV